MKKKVGFVGIRGMVGSVLLERMIEENDFSQRLANDERVPLDLQEIKAILNDPGSFAAFAPEQAENFATQVQKWTERFPEAKKLVPQALL